MGNWTRLRYNLTTPLSKDGRRVTGSLEHISLSLSAARESMVLLKNNDGALPLEKGKRVALFGKGICDYVKGGGGSGDVYCEKVVNLLEAMEEKERNGEISLFKKSNDYYREYVSRLYSKGGIPGLIRESDVPSSLVEEASMFTDTAIFSISRFSGENWDRSRKNDPVFSSDEWTLSLLETQKSVFQDGDFYLSHEEKALFEKLKSSFASIIVVVNAGSVIDTDWISREEKVKACLMAYQGGMMGGVAISDVLLGYSPSGRLPDTFAHSLESYYSTSSFHESNEYVNYTEDIFVGYRYFNTIPGAERVVYPFGYGLSYTSFILEEKKCTIQGERVELEICVKNTGERKGKDVVEIFVSSPSQTVLDRPKYVLAAFGKTKELDRGESTTLKLSFSLYDISSYDDEGSLSLNSWVLEKGKYSILYTDDAISFKETTLAIDIEETIVFYHTPSRLSPSRLPYRLKADGSLKALPVVNTPGLEPGFPRQDIDTLEGVLPKERTYEGERRVFSSEDNKLSLSSVKSGEITLSHLISKLPLDTLISITGGQPNRGVANTFGFGNAEEYGIPSVMTADGPAGLRLKEDCAIPTTAWPCATALASSWDTELLYKVGKAGGMEVKENGIGLWLTPAVNIHRSPLCGRNFEYYSEDPLLTGKLAAAMVKGIQDNGIGASLKHFAANNKETGRKDSDSRVSERALREIYLKQFEIVVKEAKPLSIMSSYNIINGTRASENKDLLTHILREEWGFEGFVTSDWWTHGEHYLELLAGNDLKMGNGYPERVKRAFENGYITREDLERNVFHILSSILKME